MTKKEDLEWLYWIRNNTNNWPQKRYAAQRIIKIETGRDVSL